MRVKPCKAKRASFWGCPSPAAWSHPAESSLGESSCDFLPCFSALLFWTAGDGCKTGLRPAETHLGAAPAGTLGLWMNCPMPCSWPQGRLRQARGGRAGIRGRRAASSRELLKFKLCQNNFHPSIKKNKSSRGRIWSHGGSVAAPQWGSGAGESKPGFPQAAAPRGSKNR